MTSSRTNVHHGYKRQKKNCDVAITLEDVDRIVDKKGNWKAAGEQNRVEMNLRFKKN